MSSKENSLGTRTRVLGFFVLAFWVTEGIDWFLGGALNQLGVMPRNTDWLWGIALAPFLHGNFAHLIGNTIPFLVLGWFILLDGTGTFFAVFFLSALTAGLGIWIFGAPGSVHIGASGVVFGFLGYLLLRGVFQRSLKSILLAVVTGVLYGGAIWGVLPGVPGVSWEGHLFGFLGGGLAAKLSSSKEQ